MSLALEIAGGILAGAIPSSIAALAATRGALISKVREQHWQQALEKKGHLAENLIESMNKYPKIVSKLYNLSKAMKLEDVSSLGGTLWNLFKQIESNLDSERKEIIRECFPAPETATKESFNYVVQGLANYFVLMLVEAQRDLNRDYARLTLVSYDPGKLKPIDSLAVSTTNNLISDGPYFTDIDFDRIFSDWRETSGRVVAYLRLDLYESGKSYSKCRNVSPDWIDKMKGEHP